MQRLKALNSKERKEIYKQLNAQFGTEEKLDFIFLESSKKKIYLISKDFEKLDVSKLRINNKAMYFGKREIDGFRMSIEGSQMIDANKNVLEVDETGMKKWLEGEDVDVEHETCYVLVKFKKDILGCGRVVNNKLRNMVPKERRLKELSGI